MTRIMLLGVLCFKIHLYVYQNAIWNQKEFAPKINPQKKTFFCQNHPPPPPPPMCVFILEFLEFGGVVSSFTKSPKSSLKFDNASSTTTYYIFKFFYSSKNLIVMDGPFIIDDHSGASSFHVLLSSSPPLFSLVKFDPSNQDDEILLCFLESLALPLKQVYLLPNLNWESRKKLWCN